MVYLDQFGIIDDIPINEKEVDAFPVMAMKLSAMPVVHGATMVSDQATLF